MTCPQHSTRGFLLIELMVMITIVGLITVIALGSLSFARPKSVDASIKENLVNARSQAEVFYLANGNSYLSPVDVCAPGALAEEKGTGHSALHLLAFIGGGNTKGVYDFVRAAAQAAGISTVTFNAIGTASTAVCNSSANAWSAQIPLKQGGFFCVDNTGIGTTTQISVILRGNDYICS